MSPNITLSWVLALAPEIALLVILFCVLLYEKLFKPSNPRQVGPVSYTHLDVYKRQVFTNHSVTLYHP